MQFTEICVMHNIYEVNMKIHKSFYNNILSFYIMYNICIYCCNFNVIDIL